MQRPLAFISGGSSGIGFACAVALVRRGWRVVIAARTAGALDTARSAIGADQVSTVVLDVADDGACVAAIAAVERDIGPIDMLVTSAGICVPGELSTQDIATHRRHFD
ncbi:MAG TPA: SDR family NAD(P)-dependent oxidoreductase, partial [Myxococcota bacterium]